MGTDYHLDKAVHVITSLKKIAGAERSLLNLLGSNFARQNIVISLKTIEAVENQAMEEEFPGTKFVALNCGKFLMPAALTRLRILISEFTPDVVLSWMYHSNVAATLSLAFMSNRPPLIWSVHHGLDAFHKESRSTRIAIALSAFLARVPDEITYVSHRVAAQHKRLFSLARKSSVVANSIKLHGKPAERAAETAHTIGLASRYHKIKDFPAFFTLSRHLLGVMGQVRIIACGDGVILDNPSLHQELSQAGLAANSIELLGQVKEMSTFYNQLDLLLLTSRSEAFGMVLAEAIAHGVACVSTDTGCAREIIGDAGLIIDAATPELSAQQIVRFLDRPKDEREELCQRQTTIIQEKYAPNTIASQFADLLRHIVDSRSSLG